MTTSSAHALAEVVRKEWPQLVATLVRVTGDLKLAEDAAQDAAEQALRSWPDGLPDRPAAWILVVARRRAIDRIRREATGRRKAELLARLEAWEQRTIDDPAETITGLETNVRDDQLRLIFGCCHPALSEEAQTALTLRSVGGLSTGEIASAFLVSDATMAQRIVRAKRKIARAAIPFVLPPDSELLDRLSVVRRILYLIFNEGYAASSGETLLQVSLCDEAIRLTRLLVSLVPDDAETLALLALMLSTHARAAGRIDSDGVPVLLPEQDRSRWNQVMIIEARDVLDRALRLRSEPHGRALQIQAAVSQLHADVQVASETDWHQIAVLYGQLEAIEPTPVVMLNRAVALAMSNEPATGLKILNDPDLASALHEYRYFHAARADLLARVGQLDDARSAYDRAIELGGSAGETELLRRKQAAL